MCFDVNNLQDYSYICCTPANWNKNNNYFDKFV